MPKEESMKEDYKTSLSSKTYIELLEELKAYKMSGRRIKSLREQAIEELLNERVKTLEMKEIHDISEHISKETENTKKYIKKIKEEN